MFGEVLVNLVEINKTLKKTNTLLEKIEENTRVPDLVEWAKSKHSES